MPLCCKQNYEFNLTRPQLQVALATHHLLVVGIIQMAVDNLQLGNEVGQQVVLQSPLQQLCQIKSATLDCFLVLHEIAFAVALKQ